MGPHGPPCGCCRDALLVLWLGCRRVLAAPHCAVIMNPSRLSPATPMQPLSVQETFHGFRTETSTRLPTWSSRHTCRFLLCPCSTLGTLRSAPDTTSTTSPGHEGQNRGSPGRATTLGTRFPSSCPAQEIHSGAGCESSARAQAFQIQNPRNQLLCYLCSARF